MSKKKTTKTKHARTRRPAAPIRIVDGDQPVKPLGKAPKPKKAAKPATPKRTSALDAAAQVLGDAKQPMNAKSLIEAMAERKLWTSPGGKTPHATLYAAMLREITDKGKDARFKKVERGLFAHA